VRGITRSRDRRETSVVVETDRRRYYVVFDCDGDAMSAREVFVVVRNARNYGPYSKRLWRRGGKDSATAAAIVPQAQKRLATANAAGAAREAIGRG
jgi:hypothetical protein